MKEMVYCNSDWTSEFVQLEPLYSEYLWSIRKDCPDYRSVLIPGIKDVLWLNIVNRLVPMVCIHTKRVSAIQGSRLEGMSAIQGSGLELSAIQGSGLEGCLQFRVWIRAVYNSGSGLKGCLQFRGLD